MRSISIDTNPPRRLSPILQDRLEFASSHRFTSLKHGEWVARRPRRWVKHLGRIVIAALPWLCALALVAVFGILAWPR